MAIKISDLPLANTITSDDLLVVVNDPSGSPETRQIAAGDLFANVAFESHFADLHIDDVSTPVTSSDTVTQGKIWADADYIYVATANNVIKRVALSTF